MSTPKIHVSMLSLTQHNLEAAITFYKTLGLPMTFQVEKKWAEFDINGIRLFLYYIEEELPDRYTGIALQVDDLTKFYSEFKDKGIEFISEPTQVDYAFVASIKDPGNNIIGLVQPTPERVREMLNKKESGQSGSTSEDDCCATGCGCE
jgi:predicted enzyme related to lactoylglutathione lyase